MNPHKPRRSVFPWLALVVLSLLCPGLSTLARAEDNPPGGYHPATWNMQRKPSNWDFAATMAATYPVVAFQEVPLQPNTRTTTFIRAHPGLHIPGRDRSEAISEYRWEVRPNVYRTLFILSNNTSEVAARNGLNLAISLPEASPDPANPGQARYQTPQEVVGMNSRTGLLVRDVNTQSYWGSIHAMSGSGNDGPALANNMINLANHQSPDESVTILGDWNRDPGLWMTRHQLPRGTHLYRPHQPTHDNGEEFDYAISTLDTSRWASTRIINDNLRSDHRGVGLGSMAAAAEHVERVTIESGLSDLVLDPGPNSRNGSFVMARSGTGAPSQKWFLVRLTSGSIPNAKHVYRIVNAESMQCLDAYKGVALLADCHLPDPLNFRPAPDGYTQEFVMETIPDMDSSSFRLRNLTTQDAITALGIEDGSNFAPSPTDAADPAQVFHMHSVD